jgi:hypothetical protein
MCGFNLDCWLAFFNYDFWQSFISNALATLIGAGLGVYGALWLNNHLEKSNRNERKKKILGVLLAEINENIVALEIWEVREINFNKLSSIREPVISLYTSLSTVSWDAFSNGGELEWIDDPLTLNIFAANYNHINSIQYLADICINFAYSNSQIFDLEPLIFAGKRLGEKIHTTLITLTDTQKYLEDVLKKLGN